MRSQLLYEFTRRLDQWLTEDYDADGWNRSWREDDPDNPYTDLKNLDMASLKEKIQSNKALHLTPARVTLPAGRYAPVQEARHGQS